MSENNLIYVAGAYRAKTDWRRQINITRAMVVGIQLLRAGYVPIIPHSMYANFDGECEDTVFLSAGIELLKRCRAVVLVPGWETSSGVAEELKIARSLQMPVFVGVDALKAADSFTEEQKKEAAKLGATE